MTPLTEALADAGGISAPEVYVARLRELVHDSLARGDEDLAQARSGYAVPVEVAFAAGSDRMLAALPVATALRADPAAVNDRAWALTAAVVGSLAELADLGPPAGPGDLLLETADLEGHLVLTLPLPEPDAELAALAFDLAVAPIDRLRASAAAVPAAVLATARDHRPPVGANHPLRVAEIVGRLGGAPASEASVEALEDSVLGLLTAGAGPARPHEERDPVRRAARRILQRLAGMGKWGGYHTEWAHLARGFAGNDRQLAYRVGEKLLEAGLLEQKPSVSQRHVFLNPRRAGDIHRLIDEGVIPPGLRL